MKALWFCVASYVRSYQVESAFPFYREGSWGSEMTSMLPNAFHPMRVIPVQNCLALEPDFVLQAMAHFTSSAVSERELRVGVGVLTLALSPMREVLSAHLIGIIC